MLFMFLFYLLVLVRAHILIIVFMFIKFSLTYPPFHLLPFHLLPSTSLLILFLLFSGFIALRGWVAWVCCLLQLGSQSSLQHDVSWCIAHGKRSQSP
eukprot:m.17799 g.17799  ORF g.17799 m.17799 type:complete len:97 (+) comp4839_c0_seq1:79-369(+)